MTTENEEILDNEQTNQDEGQEAGSASEETPPTDFNDMDPDQLAASLEDGEDGPDDDGTPDEASSDDEADDDFDDETPDDESASEDDQESTPDSEDEEAADEDDQPSGDRLKDTQAAFHKERAEKKKLLEENAALRRRNLELTKPLKPDQLTDQELADMKVMDPERYADVMIARKQYDDQVAAHEEEVKQHEATSAQEAQALADDASLFNLAAAASELLGIDGIDHTLPITQQPQEYQDLLQSKELQKTIEKIDGDPERWYEKDGSISAETILVVHRGLNHKTIEANGRIKGQQQALSNIKKARAHGSKHDQVGKAPAGGKQRKSIKTLTQGEIHDMDEAQLASYYDDAAAQGLL